MPVKDILADLVAFPSVCRTPNGAIVDHVRWLLAKHGIASTLLPGPEGDRSNLFATIGPADVPGYILSAHLDVVPAPSAGWSGDPFRLRADGDRLLGRGAVDMKGFVACILASLPAFTGQRLARPIHIALSYDEEVGCVGVRHLLPHLPQLCAPPLGCVVGEPTGLRPVLRHKGKLALRATIHGKAGHSSRPELADNAIHVAADLIRVVRDGADALTCEGPFDTRFEPPCSTMQVGTIRGGIAVNIVPDLCAFDVEARAIPGTPPAEVLAPLLASIEEQRQAALRAGRQIRIETETLSEYPALDLPDDHPLAAFVEGLTGNGRMEAVSFGTEAGLYQAAGVPSIVCGPGDIARAHQPDEYILGEELALGMRAMERLAERLRV